jgi:hypothetical protein
VVSPPPDFEPDSLLPTPPGSLKPSPSATEAVEPGGSVATGGPGAGFPSDPTPPEDPLDEAEPPLYQQPDLSAVSFVTGNLSIGIEWVVPTFLITVPGFLLIVVALAQAMGGFAWLPVVRRLLSGDGRRRTK